MKTVYDKATRDELIARIKTLNGNSKAQWGTMTIYQMLKHCTLWEEMITGKTTYKRAFIGLLFGKIALKVVLRDDKPLSPNTPTLVELRITGSGNVLAERDKWVSQIEEYEHSPNPQCVHAFFGKLTKEQIGQLVYKHTDHHLRQFNS